MKEYKRTYIDPTHQEMTPILGVNKEMTEKGIYARYNISNQTITATGDYHITNGFPPRLVEIEVRETDQMSTGKTDFTTTYSIRSYSTGGATPDFNTSSSSNLISLDNLVGNATIRYVDGFNLNISSFSGSDKTLFITCYS